MMGSDLPRAFRIQAEACRKMGSPFNGALLDFAAADIEAGGPTAPLLAPWAEASLKAIFDDAAHLRFVGALHDLVLSGDDPALAAPYPNPDRPGAPARAWTAALDAMTAHHARLAAFMGHEPQTNEVRRSVCLAPGFLVIAAATGLPIRAFEAAASAGLNQSWDRYRYDFGAAQWGDPGSPVQLDTDWTGPAPPVGTRVEVVARAACDRRPTDLADPVQRRRLAAYIWPDQFERLERLHAAIAVAGAHDVRVEAADAVAWTAERAAPHTGAVSVLYHSVFWTYMPAQAQAALVAAIEAHGAAARPEAPFAWLRMEPRPDDLSTMELRLTLWPGGEERLLAEAHPHGAWVKWFG